MTQEQEITDTARDQFLSKLSELCIEHNMYIAGTDMDGGLIVYREDEVDRREYFPYYVPGGDGGDTPRYRGFHRISLKEAFPDG